MYKIPLSCLFLFLRFLLAGFVLFLGISGCQTTPGTEITSGPSAENTERPWLLSDAETFVERARRTSNPASANEFYLEAARVYLALGDVNRAEEAYAHIVSDYLTPELRVQYRLFRLELLMDTQDMEAAWQDSQSIRPISDTDMQQLLQLRARIAEGMGNYAEAASLLMSLLPRSPEPQPVIDKIWQYVNLTPPAIAEQKGDARSVQGESPEELGWWRLAIALQQGFDPAEQRQILRNWIKMHPQHSIAAHLPTSLQHLLLDQLRYRRVALMLPLSGPLGNAGRVVRDGYVSAYLYRARSEPEAAAVPVRIYDTYGQDIAALHEDALSAGAEIIVGPLSKAKVAQLNQLPGRQLPVIALNYLPDNTATSSDFFQIGLAIEDEARALARRLRSKGFNNVALVHGPDNWAVRGAEAFQRFWLNQPDAQLNVEGFSDPRKITQTVGDLFNVAGSIERHERLDRLLGTHSEMVPRSRQDIQALVAMVDGRQMQALQPALAFHFVKNTPIYSSSQAIQDLSQQDYSSLEGLNLCEIPWIVGQSRLKRKVASAFSDYNNRVAPLYALGSDAYRLSTRLDLMLHSANSRLLGATGVLTLGLGGRLQRDLVWASIHKGKLVRTDSKSDVQ